MENEIDLKKGDWEAAIDNSLTLVRKSDDLQQFLTEIIGNGYFPKQLPPPFQTVSFSSAFKNHQEDYIKILKKVLWRKNSMESAQLYKYSYARPRQLRRIFSIPNPAHFILLSLELAASWQELYDLSNSSSFSMSKPTRHVKDSLTDEEIPIDDLNLGLETASTLAKETENNVDEKRSRSLEFSNTWDKLSEKKLACRSTAKYIAKADIARFFPTIYTHMIPWILHGKETSKNKKNDYSLLGNRLDTLIRNAQDGQTLGLPIGPDSSFLISECILSKIDNELQQRLKGCDYKIIRIVDDYEFACFNRSTAEKCISVLQEILLEYELELNTYKSEIL